MSKTGGLGSVLSVDNSGGVSKTITNDVTNYSFSTPRASQDVTGLDKSAVERILLLADYTNTLNGVLNTDADMSHDVFKTVPSTSVARTTSIQVLTGGGTPKLDCEVLYTDYQITRSATGELTWQAPGSLSSGTTPAWS